MAKFLLELATVGLGVSDLGYGIFALLVSVVSCMDSVYGFSVQAWPLRREAGDSIP